MLRLTTSTTKRFNLTLILIIISYLHPLDPRAFNPSWRWTLSVALDVRQTTNGEPRTVFGELRSPSITRPHFIMSLSATPIVSFPVNLSTLLSAPVGLQSKRKVARKYLKGSLSPSRGDSGSDRSDLTTSPRKECLKLK